MVSLMGHKVHSHSNATRLFFLKSCSKGNACAPMQCIPVITAIYFRRRNCFHSVQIYQTLEELYDCPSIPLIILKSLLFICIKSVNFFFLDVWHAQLMLLTLNQHLSLKINNFWLLCCAPSLLKRVQMFEIEI